jgi:mannan endo-1,4-beta-mannosidase
MVAATEVGAAPLPDLLEAYDVHWLWFAVWGDTFINSAEWNPPQVLQEIYNSDYVLTLDEIQGWRG